MNSKQALTIVGTVLLVFFVGCGVLGFAGWRFFIGAKAAVDCSTFGRAGDYEKAIPACREAARQLPHSSTAHNELGWYLTLSGKADEGLIECKMAVSLNPSNMNALDSLAMAEALSGHPADALRDSERAYRRQPTPGKQVTHGMALYANGRYDEGIREWQQASQSSDSAAVMLAKRFLDYYTRSSL